MPDSGIIQQVLMDLPTGICILHSPDHVYAFTNTAYEQFVGRTYMLGKTVRDLFPEIAGQGIYELLDQVYTTGVPFTTREIIKFDRHGTGGAEEVYFDLTYRSLRSADGVISGVVAYVLDISDRRALDKERAQVLHVTQEAQSTLEAQQQRLLSVLRQAPTAICTLEGPEHVFTFTNPLYDQLVGRQGLVGKTVRAGVPEAEDQGFLDLLDTVYATGVPVIGNEVPIKLGRQGTGILEQNFLNIVYTPLRDANEAISGIFVEAVNVTELVTARQRADAALVLRDQFLSIAAHELKTPLTSIIGFIQVLQRRLRKVEDLDERTDRAVTMIGTQSQRLARLIDMLMDVSRINLGHLALDRALLDLSALTKRVVHKLSIALDQRAIEVVIPPQSYLVLADSLRLEQVILNLVQNAVKYSPEGGPVQVMVVYEAEQAWLRVRDWGIGIPTPALPYLFERFYRVREGAAHSIVGWASASRWSTKS